MRLRSPPCRAHAFRASRRNRGNQQVERRRHQQGQSGKDESPIDRKSTLEGRLPQCIGSRRMRLRIAPAYPMKSAGRTTSMALRHPVTVNRVTMAIAGTACKTIDQSKARSSLWTSARHHNRPEGERTRRPQAPHTLPRQYRTPTLAPTEKPGTR